MYAAVFATSKATVTLQCGSSSSTFTVNPGVNLLKIPLAFGKMTVKMVRNGKTIINETPQDFNYIPNPTLCAFFSNDYLGSCLTHTFIWGFRQLQRLGWICVYVFIGYVGFMMPNSLYSSISWQNQHFHLIVKLFQLSLNFDLLDKTILRGFLFFLYECNGPAAWVLSTIHNISWFQCNSKKYPTP